MSELPPFYQEYHLPPPFPPEENGDEGSYVLTSEDAEFLDRAAEGEPILSNAAPVPLPKKIMSALLSGVINIVFLILLALVFFQARVKHPMMIDAVFSDRLGDQLDVETLDEGNADPNPAEQYELTMPEETKIDEQIAPERLDFDEKSDSLLTQTEASRIDITSLFDGRTDPGTKNDLLSKYGGNQLTIDAVNRGLVWLKNQQLPDGSWSLKEPYRDGAVADNHTAATGLALLAFQGDGNTRFAGKYRQQVKKAWKWLLKQQGENGSFFRDFEGVSTGRFYTQAICTIGICELIGMEKKGEKGKDLLNAAQKAVDYLVERQNRRQGGWRYDVEEWTDWVLVRNKERKQVVKEMSIESDLSVTGWCLMALMSARAAGLYVPDETFERIEGFLDLISLNGGDDYFYSTVDRSERPSMTATGLLCREYLGWDRQNPHLVRGAENLIQPKNLVRYPSNAKGDNPAARRRTNVYGWYSASMMLKQLGAGSHYWQTWNRALSREIPAHQVPEGSAEAGSWDPADDDYCFGGGRLYVTCLSIYCMEVYYRHLALYGN
ncbi:MAG: terpene cyclase/mutase family protein [Thermoguttaceae bacterium]|nr:terpene cyclase/mutase family protein [Thermoguttaceae bacterium]